MDEIASEDLADFTFSLDRSLRYHQRRRAFLERLNRWLMFAVIVLGSAAAAPFLRPTFSAEGLALAAALIGALNLVLAPGQRARDHLVLHQSYSALMAEIARKLKPTAEDLCEWRARRIEIETDEPPIYWAVEKDCYNEVCHARGKKGAVEKLNWRERWFMNYFRFEVVSS